MPLTFIINPDIDRNIRELTLAYAFFPAPTGGPR
jgi:cytochrome c oxidase assembly protein Cox11